MISDCHGMTTKGNIIADLAAQAFPATDLQAAAALTIIQTLTVLIAQQQNLNLNLKMARKKERKRRIAHLQTLYSLQRENYS